MVNPASIVSSCRWRFEPCGVVQQQSEPLSDGAAEGNENLALIAVAIDQSLCDRAVDL
jgi:hypothetical protein